MTKVPPDAVAAGVGDFQIPTATEGRVVSICLGGNIRINAPNCIWYGDYAAIERTQTTGVIIKKDQTIGYTYELALAYALLKGECAGITKIWIGDEPVWDKDIDNGGVPGTVCDVDRDDLFGGKNNGGGFIGRFRLFNGSESQGVSAFMTTRILEGLPAYRGTSYVLVTDIAETKGAEIGEQPNLRYFRFEVQMWDTVANGGLGDVLALGNDHHFIGDDANPISIAYDMFINDRWGRGLPPSDVNKSNFTATAETIWAEGIGFSMLIDEFTSTEQIQDWIEQHCDCYIGPNAVTGQFEVNLARPDYVLANEYQANESNIVAVKTWNKGDWSQTFNRVRMRYADRAKDWDETHAVANAPSNRIIQGRLKSQEVRYPGVHAAFVANKIVAREKKNLARPARSGTIELNRTAWQLRPGMVFSFTSPTVDETDLPVRITKVEIGDPIRNTLVMEVVEDIFDNETPTVADPPATDFVPPTQDVDPFLVADQWAVESPYMMIRQDPTTPNVPGRVVTAGRIATGAPTEYEVRVRDPGGSGSYVSISFITGGFMTAGTLRNAEVGILSGNGGKSLQVDPIAGSLDALIGPQSPGIGNMTGVAVINPGASNEEWVVFSDIVDDLTGVRLEGLWRGALDTTMYTHSAGERVWFIWTGGFGLPEQQFANGASIDVKLLPRSPTDAVAEGDATAITPVTFLPTLHRYYRPLLPSEVALNGVNFANVWDLTSVLTVTGNPTEFLGGRAAPRLRDWRNQDPLDQANGGGIRSDIWGDDQHEVTYWLYNLETHPSPVRANAVVTKTAAATFATDGQIDVLSSEVEAEFIAADKNDLAMRLEVETSHISGASQPRVESRDVHFFDFTGSGVFVVPFDAVYLHLTFEQSDFVRDYRPVDLSPNNHQLFQIGTDAGANTASTPPLGTYAWRFGKLAGQTFPSSDSSYLMCPASGDATGRLDFNQDWTVEFRARFDSATTSHDMIGQEGVSGGYRWQIRYDAGQDRFELDWSTTGTGFNGAVGFGDIGTFLPVIDTWYALMFSRKEELDGTFTFRSFVDGVKVSETAGVAAFTIDDTGTDSFLSIGATDYNRQPVSGSTSAGLDGYIDELRITQGYALEAIDYTPEVASFPFATKEWLIAQSSFEGEAGNDTNKHAEDFASADTAWIYDGTQAQCRIAGDKSKFGRTSLFVNGTQDAGLRWGNFETIAQMGHQHLLGHDWTIEGWVNFTALPSSGPTSGMAMCGMGDNGGNEREWFFGIDENDELEFSYWDENAEATEVNIKATTTPALVADTWYWLAVCRNGVAIEGWIDGDRVLNDATFFEDGGSNPVVFNGGEQTAALSVGKAFRDESGDLHRSMNGHVDDFRIIKRSALYTGDPITVPTARLEKPKRFRAGSSVPDNANVYYHNHFNDEDETYDPAWHLTVSLLEFEGTDLDTTTTDEGQLGTSWTFAGNANIDSAQSAIGSTSLELDGTGDFLSSTDAVGYDLNDLDFTLECFVRFNGDPGTAQMTFLAKWDTTGAFRAYWFGLNNNQLELLLSTTGSNTVTINEAWNPADATWYHVAAVRADGRIELYVDGARIGTGVANTSDVSNETSVQSIGAYNTAGTAAGLMNGWIDQARMTIGAGAGRYTPGYGYPVPTAARSQKLGYEYPGDLSPNAHTGLVASGSLVIDRDVKKFGTASLYLDGSSYLGLDANGPTLSANGFVIEAQVRFDGDPLTGNATFLSAWDTSSSDEAWILALRNNELVFEWNDGGSNFTTAGTWDPATAVWYHVMVSKVQGMIRLFVDGTQVGTAYECDTLDRAIDDAGEDMVAGCHFVATVATDYFTGWIDEVRVLVGSSATEQIDFPDANFTAPTDEYDFHRVRSQPYVNRDVKNLGIVSEAAINQPGTNQQQGSMTEMHTDLVTAAPAQPTGFADVAAVRGGGFSKAWLCGSGTSYIRVPAAVDMRLYNADFTMEGWFYQTANSTQCYSSHAEISGGDSWFWRYNATTDSIEFGWSTDGVNYSTVYADWTQTFSQWYHLAVTREGDTFRFFVDGVLLTNNVASATPGTDVQFFVTGAEIGWFSLDANFGGGNPSQVFVGYAFDMRLVIGKALHTATFTKPANHLPQFGQCIDADY